MLAAFLLGATAFSASPAALSTSALARSPLLIRPTSAPSLIAALSVRGVPPDIARQAGISTSALVIKEDYRLALAFLLSGSFTMAYTQQGAGFLAGFFLTALGLVFGAQTMRVRFVLDKDDFRVMKAPLSASWGATPGAIEPAGDNVVVGGTNRWKYKSFVNYGFFPKGFVEAGLPPILFYFKETQTPQKGARGPGKVLSDASTSLLGEARNGQVHFAPAMCDCRELDAQLKAKGAKRLPVW
jgi:hypothetical protein